MTLRTSDFESYRFYHMFDKTPTEVAFLGQRETDFISITIFGQNITVCEVEVLGRRFIFFLKGISFSILYFINFNTKNDKLLLIKDITILGGVIASKDMCLPVLIYFKF